MLINLVVLILFHIFVVQYELNSNIMKTLIKFKCLDLRGNIVYIKKKYEHPEFKDETFSSLLGIELGREITTTAESKIVDWLDEQDKRDLMIDNDIHCIIDYSIVKKRAKKETRVTVVEKESNQLFEICEILNRCFDDNSENKDRIIADFLVCYDKMKDSLKGLKVDKQMSIVFSSIGVAYESASNAYKHISNYGKTMDTMYEENKKAFREANPQLMGYVKDFTPTSEEIHKRMEDDSMNDTLKIEN
jgi:hypothetical protein